MGIVVQRGVRRREPVRRASTLYTTIMRRSAAFFIALIALLPGSLSAQQAAAVPPGVTTVGRVTGRIIDAGTGTGIPDAQIGVVGVAGLGTTSGVDGRFTLRNVPTGPLTLYIRRIGYGPKSVTGLYVDNARTLEQDVTLEIAATQLMEQVVSVQAERGSVAAALDAQRTASAVVNAITAEQISRSPDGNAAQAVSRGSGVNVADGGTITVRGLSDKYTVSSLNGARVPSPEPERRVVPLDLFPAGLLQTINIVKTFTPDQQGDFSGAVVDMRTREFPAERMWAFQLNGGYAAGATGSSVIAGQTVGGEGVALANGRRSLPSAFREIGNMKNLSLAQSEKNYLISRFRNAWTPASSTALPNSSGSLTVGGNDAVPGGLRVGYLFSGTFSAATDVKDGHVRALANRGATRGETVEIDRFSGTTATQGVLWGGLANLSTMIGEGTRLAFNGLYDRTADNSARVETGAFENEAIRARITRMQYVERSVRSGQLTGTHQISANQELAWTATLSGVSRSEPDRSEFVQAIERDASGADVLRWLNTGNGGAVRTFMSLAEQSREAKLDYRLLLSGGNHLLRAGLLARRTDRDADQRAYAISAPGAPESIRELRPEQIFDGRFFQADAPVSLDIAPLAEGGSYAAHDRLGAGYIMSEVSLGRARFVGGVRYEADDVRLDALSTLGTPIAITRRWNDLLPSLALNYRLAESHQLRVSVSHTLARPEYRELSPITSRDVLNGDDTQGSENLRRTNITNADVRWEWYPRSGEVLSVGVFGKRFEHPIERVYRAASTRVVFYTNAERADNYGVELEARKSMGFVSGRLTSTTLFSNLTLMHSEITLDPNTQAAATNLRRSMIGQAPYVLNAGVSYVSPTGRGSAAILFNRVGDRIDAAGESPLPDVIQEARNALDLSLRIPIGSRVAMRLDGRNILDAPFRIRQGTVTREAFRSGRVVQAGLQWSR
jgi:hypothetical protein